MIASFIKVSRRFGNVSRRFIKFSRRFAQILYADLRRKKGNLFYFSENLRCNLRKSARTFSSARTSAPAILVITILLLFSVIQISSAQRISFGTWAGSDITLTVGVPGDLDFNDKTPVINPGVNQSVTINLQDAETAVLSIEGTEYYDVTVYVDAPGTLDLDPDNKLPVAIRFAYSNLNAPNVTAAKNQAVEVPVGFNTATFPILRRVNGPPGPPPTPPNSGYTPPRKTAYLFIYGTLGPVGSVDAGLYNGIIHVTVEYTKFN